ncbi:MAG: TIGR02281 family clan AA aspartic protease [Alphaproteobacteria bacterium]|nr:TIGR02281 family clan AA aspartic protease [Alphaproteobacteria bacterium]
MNRSLLWWLGAVAVVGALVWSLADRFPERLDGDVGLQLAGNLVQVVLLLGAAAVGWRARPGTALRAAAAWVAIAAVLAVGYSYRDRVRAVVDRVGAELLPHRATVTGDSVALRRGEDGQFVAEALVNGTPVRFLVDTGATSVALTPRDARRIGLDPDRLIYSVPLDTAAGRSAGAPIRLAEIAIGPITAPTCAATSPKR